MNHSGRISIALLLLVAGLSACGDDDDSAQEGKDSGQLESGVHPSTSDDDAGDDMPGDLECESSDDDGGAGDGSCEPGKHCDDGHCVWDFCGDGIVDGDEECDDGNELTGDSCNPGCKQISARCMDGIMQDDEECDDGNFFNADDCSNSCTLNECGNERVDLDEECDDGNLIDTDFCSNECTENRCRNGRLDPGEECDDGNTEPHDSCSNACTKLACGDGQLQGEEECDDGNGVDDDECSNMCTENVCGNLRVDPGEVCDGGTLQMTCSADCQQQVDNTACLDCLELNCRDVDFSGIDAYGLCIDNTDATYAKLCQDAAVCAWVAGCYVPNDSRFPQRCLCGHISTDAECQSVEDPHDPRLGPCYDAFAAAAMSDLPFDVLNRREVETQYPSGGAFWLAKCSSNYCLEECHLADHPWPDPL